MNKTELAKLIQTMLDCMVFYQNNNDKKRQEDAAKALDKLLVLI